MLFISATLLQKLEAGRRHSSNAKLSTEPKRSMIEMVPSLMEIRKFSAPTQAPTPWP